MASIDHLVVTAATVAAGAAHVEAALRQPMGPGGKHPAMGTHNRLSGLGESYLEVIAADPKADRPDGPRWFALDGRRGPPALDHWVVRVDDLDAAIAAHPDAGAAMAFERGPFRWRMAVPPDGRLPYDHMFPALIAWDTDPPRLPDSGLRLSRLTLRHPDAAGMAVRLASLIDDPRLTVEPGRPGMEARIETPAGRRRLR